MEFNVPQIAFKIGNFEIYFYSLCIVIGIVLSLILAITSKEKYGIKFEDLLEILAYSLVGGVIGARLYYCLFNIKFYIENPNKIFAFRDGGLAIYGGIIFGVFISFIVSKIKKVEFNNLLDYIAPYLVLAQAIGRFGNFFNVEAYGYQTTSFFRMGIFKNGSFIEVHPCFLYEFMACFVIFIILKILQNRRKFQLEIFADYMIFYGIIRFFIEALRADSLYFENIKISQAVSLIFVIIGIIIHINKSREKSNIVNRNRG